MYYLTLFMIFSILGFLFENVIAIFMAETANSGILYGPWTPIFGIGILIILLIGKIVSNLKLNKKTEIFLFFVAATIMLTLIEFIAGHLIERFLDESYWDYSKLPLNIGKYISVEISLFWGLLATLINYYIYPKLKNLLKQIPNKITICLTFLFIVDIIIKFINSVG